MIEEAFIFVMTLNYEVLFNIATDNEYSLFFIWEKINMLNGHVFWKMTKKYTTQERF